MWNCGIMELFQDTNNLNKQIAATLSPVIFYTITHFIDIYLAVFVYLPQTNAKPPLNEIFCLSQINVG